MMTPPKPMPWPTYIKYRIVNAGSAATAFAAFANGMPAAGITCAVMCIASSWMYITDPRKRP